MLPTLEVLGDNVLISRAYRRGKDIKVGDIVSFDSVVDEGRVIKRVLGMPGDYVLRYTPGMKDTMLQVCIFQDPTIPRMWVTNDSYDDRCLKATAGSWEIICRILGIRECLGPCLWR
jgi:signal peptidase I